MRRLLAAITLLALATAAALAPPLGGSPPSVVLPSFTLVSPNTGALPFTIGMPFAKGTTTGPLTLNIPNAQVVAVRTWNDGSIKHAIISGHAALTANIPLIVNVIQGSVSGTNLTCTDIQNAAPSATVAFSGGLTGTADLSTLFASPVRTFVAGSQMVECHYKQRITNGTNSPILVLFHVRLYKPSNRLWIRAVIENGYLTGSATVTYTAVVTIGGTQVFNGSVTHYANTSWDQTGWIGGDPQIRPTHDMHYVVNTKLVPNYFFDTPDAATLNGLFNNYTPGSTGSFPSSLNELGAQNYIALLPLWDAITVTSLGDSRAWNSMIANARAFRSYAILWRNTANDLFVTPSGFPTATPGSAVNGSGTSDTFAGAANAIDWEFNHQPLVAYLAYLLTGDYMHLETLQAEASLNYLSRDPGTFGTGLNRYISGEIRGRGWAQRNIAAMAALTPTGDPMLSDYQTLMDKMAVFDISRINRPGWSQLGVVEPSQLGGGACAPANPGCTGAGDLGTFSAFMQGFVGAAYGFASDMEPLTQAQMGHFNAVRDFQYKWSVGIWGPGPPSGYCFNDVYVYVLLVVPNNTADNNIVDWFQSWSALYNAPLNFGGVACANTLLGAGAGGDPGLADGFTANEVSGLAYAVDHGAPGALAAYQRLTGASNYSTYRNATVASPPGYGDHPQWGIKPRSQ